MIDSTTIIGSMFVCLRLQFFHILQWCKVGYSIHTDFYIFHMIIYAIYYNSMITY